MFKRYPYWGWLFASILLWCLAWFRYHEGKEQLAPANMANAIQAELNRQERDLQELLDNKELIQKIYSGRLQESNVNLLINKPYRLFAYAGNKLIFWNNNKIVEECGNAADNQPRLLKNDRGSYIKICQTPPNQAADKKLVVLFPVVKIYPFENRYLNNHFIAGNYIPVNTQILSERVKGSHPISSINGQAVCYVLFDPSDAPNWIPDGIMLCILAGAILFSIAWIQLITITLTRKKSFGFGLLITILTIIIFRAITYIYGMPFNLDQLSIFSPQLYASSNFLRSLGDLLINALCFLWLVVFVLRHVPFNIFKNTRIPAILRWVYAIAVSVLMIVYSFGFIEIISSLVLDSMISFDVSHFYSITRYTIIGLFTICIITASSCLFIYILNVLLRSLINNKGQRYILFTLTGLLLIVANGYQQEYSYYFLLLWLVTFIVLVDIPKLVDIKDILAPQMVFWGVVLCALCTVILQYFNYKKEHETRKRFAEQIVHQRDEVTIYTFKAVAQSILNDKVLKAFMKSPTPELRKSINERFDAFYLVGHLNKYQSRVLLYDSSGNSLYNSDTVGYNSLLEQQKLGLPVSDSTLYYKEYARDGHYYMAHIVLPGDSSGTVLGHLFIDLAVKEAEGESVYPELLQPGNVKNTINDAGYSYAVYANDRLITQTSDYSFPVYLIDTVSEVHTFYEWKKISELWYKADNEKMVIVVYDNKTITQAITLFSYLFGVQMVIVLLVVFYRTGISYFSKPRHAEKFINLTLRKRIHFSMLGIVFISFLIIGIVTIVFFNYQYTQSNKAKLRKTMQAVERSVSQYLKNEETTNGYTDFNSLLNATQFRYFIYSLANVQKIDINLYGADGSLIVTSQENIYDRALLAKIIMPDAYYNLHSRSSSLFIQDERIGSLSYLSSYVPIRDNTGITTAYINVPFFASEKELNYQISNILVALINLYAFIFLISGLLTVFITQWITRTFSVVINRFEKLSLSENELIDWPYDDEIGLLVREYNKMVKKVEDSAALLAQSEREDAWREMAKQVAHEIKNPLTPMKLNIQYLQQALKNDQSNIKELALRVSKSLVEQIDNLSYIANEFSNFAKMPDAKPALLDLNELLERAVELYLNEENVQVRFEKPKKNLVVYADKSQLRRVFSNVLQNAVQAIPEDKKGLVTVSLKNDKEDIIISFADNGAGIKPDVIEKIFQPYFTTRSSGTGLGLAMTKKIIEFWRGKIWFETEEGAGSTFFISLPLVNINKD